MMAALAARQAGASVTLLERQARVGRKLLATGNGRCNLTNLSPLPDRYHGTDAESIQKVLDAFPVQDTLSFFESLGLITTAEPSGRVYPYSDQANSVVDVLRFALEASGTELLPGREVKKLKKTGSGFRLSLDGDTMDFDKVIVACGGVAGSRLGGSMSGYQLLRSLGHSCTRLRPSLVQLRSSHPRMSALKGVRAQCAALITLDGSLFAKSEGEIQFTDYGLSGPVIFEISRDVCFQKGSWICRLDLLPQHSPERISDLLERRQSRLPDLTAADLFTGLLHNRLGRVLVQQAGLNLNTPLRELDRTALTAAASLAKDLPFPLTEPMGMDAAQVTAGGIPLTEFDPSSMESRLVPGLYACGEVLDVDGDCGGYNLQWAWSSGHLAGRSAGKAVL